MKILIYIGHLASGGSEKVASMMANYFSNIHSVVLLTDASLGSDFFVLNKKVKRLSTGFIPVSTNTCSKIKSQYIGLKLLRRSILKVNPDIIISHNTISNIKVIIATYNLNIPVIIEEHNNPSMNTTLTQPWKLIKPFTFIFANKIVLLTTDLIKYYPCYLHHKIIIIPNPIEIQENTNKMEEVNISTPTFISTGNFRNIKGYDLLLQAFAIVVKKHSKWNLTILGDGLERKNLTKLSDSLGISKSVNMPGRVKNPFSILKKSDIYVLSSRSEGFPVALCEAMGVGMPCISFDCPTGPSDIIKDNVNGLLIEHLNIEKLAEAMILLIENKKLRDKLSLEAFKINETLNIDVVMQKWKDIIRNNIDDGIS